MAATPKLTSSMMQGGGVYDSIINQTQTPRANEKVLMFLDRIAPSDPVDNVVVWTDDEEPADPRLHMFAPEHRRKGFKPSSVSEENEQILDELAHSEMSYPLDEHNRGSVPRKPAGLENFGSRGWTPLNQNVPMSPPENQYAMPAARAAGAHSRPGSRVPSRMEQRRPPSTRPTPPINGPSALEIDVRPPSVDARSADGHGVRSLAATDEDVYAAGGYTTPRIKSPPPAPRPYARKPEGVVPPLYSSRTPQGLAASVALPASRAPSAMAVSRPGSRMVVRGTNPQRVATPEEHVRAPSSSAKTPVINTVTLNTGHGRGVIENAPEDEHVLGHVHELVDDEPDVVVVREEVQAIPEPAESIGHINDDDDIGHHVQEHYDVVDKETIRSSTPKARPDALVLREYPETEIVDVEGMNEHQLVEMLRTPAMRSEAIDYGDEVQRALDLHHDEDLCVLLQAAEDELQHPIVRKAVRKAIAGRLRKLGLHEDYDTVKRTPSMAAKLHKQAFGDPRDMITARLPDEAPEWAKLLSDHVQELTRQFQATNMGGSQPRQIKGREDDDDDSLHPEHAADEHGLSYQPDHLNIEPPAAGLVSPGERLYDEEVYKLRKRNAHASPRSHATWEIEEEEGPAGGGSVLNGDDNAVQDSDYYGRSPTKGTRGGHRRQDSNSQTGMNVTSPVDQEGGDWVAKYSAEADQPPPWLKVNQRLLNWAVIWPYTELENALKSCDRGEQVDEVALTIWTSQIYKRYVRAQMTQYPPATVDKMYVPPNIADAINNAAYNGRHEEVSVMLRELWAPFGFRGHPKLILALTRHRREDNHWVVHRFSLPDASIITYDTYLEKSLPDGRPLGWWFGIRMAFTNDAYPAPDQVVQRMIRLHRPLQLQVDNSVAAAAIWRNLIMGSKADRLVDLERLRDLIRQEVKGIRQKKEQGKLSLSLSRSGNNVWPSASGIVES